MEITNTTVVMDEPNEIVHDYAALEYNLRQCSFGMRHLTGGACMVTDDMTALAIIEQLEKVAYRIARSDELPIMIVQRPSGRMYMLTSLGKDLWHLGSALDSAFHKN